MICLAFLISHNLYSQQQNVSESEIDFSVIKWHYHEYPKSSNVVWNIFVSPEKETVYRASFEFKGREMTACYDESGELLTEYEHLDDELPISIQYYLEGEYRKYKVISFVKQTDFSTQDIWYTLQVKTKDQGEQQIELDKNLIPFKTELLTRF